MSTKSQEKLRVCVKVSSHINPSADLRNNTQKECFSQFVLMWEYNNKCHKQLMKTSVVFESAGKLS